MAGGGASSNASRLRKRVEAESATSSPSPSLKRARDGSAFTKCEECNKDVAVALISFHNCSLDAKIKMNLEAQVVEMANEAKKKPAAEKRKPKQTDPKAKKEKKAKNPNGKKRPPTAFFLFMDDFRKSFKEANPDCKSVATVAKEGGEKWKSMSEEEKKTYVERAAELKAEYAKSMESNDLENDRDDDESTEKEMKEEKDDLSDEEVKEIKEENDEVSDEVKEENDEVSDEVKEEAEDE